MSRIILMALVLAATVAGCNRFPDLTIQITDNLQPSDAPECAFESEQDESLLRGLWDLNVDSGYGEVGGMPDPGAIPTSHDIFLMFQASI